MNFLIDGRAFEGRDQRGIQRYYREIFSRCNPYSRIEMYIRSKLGTDLPINVHLTEVLECFPLNRLDFSGRAISKARRLLMPTRLPQADLYHSTYFTPNPRPELPEVVTIHDMIPEVIPYYYGYGAAEELAKKRKSIFAATKIIAISHATAKDLKSIYPEVEDRIEVIHHGGQHFPKVTSEELGAKNPRSEPYVLFVGQKGAYKNFSTLLDAAVDLGWPKEVSVVVAGEPFSEAERAAIRFRGLEGKFRSVIHPSDSELRGLYIGASAFVFPSLLEGFGFPLLEAQALGVPVVASDTRVFHEVAGKGFIPVRPLDYSSIAEGVSKSLDSSVSTSLISSGLENVDRFSWDVCAEETFRVWSETAREGVRIS